jgi:NAD(P)-dependent dehydrogenase (short-subunit alcohol dehydrogenase family)
LSSDPAGEEVAVRVALVTGADKGIGHAIARRLLADGWGVACATRTRGATPARELADLDEGRVAWVCGDLADPEVPSRLVEGAVRKLGRLDALVNNAGVSPAGSALEHTAEDFDLVFGVDVRAPFLLVQSAVPHLGHGSSIVNITSVHELVPRPGFALYAAAKAALGMLTRGLALELAPLGIRVNAVAPGVIATARNSEAASLVDEVPLGRPGEPREVAALVAFLLQEDSYATGSTFTIDGGLAQQVVRQPAAEEPPPCAEPASKAPRLAGSG